MTYKSIIINTTTLGAELVADILFDIGSQGVSIIDSADVIELFNSEIIWDYIEQNVFAESEVVKVTGYTSEEQLKDAQAELDTRLAELREYSEFALGSLEVSIVDIDGEDWYNTWKKFYSPIELDKIAIVPCWQNYDKDKVVVRINPGMAFGTGEHESTRMCLTLLEKLDLTDKTVSDIGCGSGILGIAALKLGAKSCYFADIDKLALENMRENATLNNVMDNATVECASLLMGSAPKSDVILANITADILIKFASQLPPFLTQDTKIIVSGIIKEREVVVLDAFAAIGLVPTNRITMKDWVALEF
ncbi:MAG: 50S ribosomal protein L11 methyltransferase [Clostridia bacterium]|nr:50S ribosomal protein L11 methyltransferase [Clostridia bacterium]